MKFLVMCFLLILYSKSSSSQTINRYDIIIDEIASLNYTSGEFVQMVVNASDIPDGEEIDLFEADATTFHGVELKRSKNPARLRLEKGDIIDEIRCPRIRCL